MDRRSLVAAGLAAAVSAALPLAPALAQDAGTYPNQAVKVIVGSPPGGPTDAFARAISEELQKKLGQPFVVENKPGASGALAAQAVLQAPADGYTLWYASPSNVIIPPLLRKPAPFDVAALTPVAVTIQGVGPLLVNPKVPANTVQEFVAYAKANPGKLNFGSSGVGSSNHLVMEMFKDATGIDVVHVPYKGNGEAQAALLAGEVQVYFGDLGFAQAKIKSGELKALGVPSTARNPALPDVPTFAETVAPGFNSTFWLGFFARKETPPAVVAKLHGTINAIMATPEMKARAEQGQMSVLTGSVDDFARLIENDRKLTGAVITKLNLSAN